MHTLTQLTGMIAGLMLASYVRWLWMRYVLIFSSGAYATMAALHFMQYLRG